MIASCWDWPSLKYAYFIIEDIPLDAGGWSPTRGIVRDATQVDSDEVVAFDDCVPALPTKNCYYAGAGDFCVGELFVKRDHDRRPELDMDLLKSQGTPDMRKIAELLEGTSQSAVERGRENPKVPVGRLRENAPRKSLWSHLVPWFTGAGAGYVMYNLFKGEESTNQNVATLLFAWSSGVAVGIAIGQEYALEPVKKEDT